MTTFADLHPADKEELWACLALRATKGVGAVRAAMLLREYGSALAATQDALATRGAWAHKGLLSAATANAFADEGWRDKAKLEWDAIQRSGCSFLLWHDPCYPRLVSETEDAPLILYYKGDASLFNAPSVAVVGARNCTHEGIAVAAFLSRGLSRAGVTVVSGMARGIDRAAHLAGLEGPGRSIAVLGTGIDKVYPLGNADLEALLTRRGLIVSEFSPGTEPQARYFPIRNRLISGLSRGVLVVEAAARSGSLITARLALEQGRDVFVVPGHTMAAVSEGCRELVRQGAKAVFNADDILSELAPLLTLKAREALELRRQEERERKKKPVPRNATRALHDDAQRTAECVLPEGELPWLMPGDDDAAGNPATAEPHSLPEPSGQADNPAGQGGPKPRHAPDSSKQPDAPEQQKEPGRSKPEASSEHPEAAPPPFAEIPENCSDEERGVLGLLGDSPLHIDDLSRQAGIEVSRLSSMLLVLEVRGLACRLPGANYTACGGKRRFPAVRRKERGRHG